ncbi:uncharacterized protein B0I36DRAFT_415107, partial [Microdochium trichocladiopsis]
CPGVECVWRQSGLPLEGTGVVPAPDGPPLQEHQATHAGLMIPVWKNGHPQPLASPLSSTDRSTAGARAVDRCGRAPAPALDALAAVMFAVRLCLNAPAQSRQPCRQERCLDAQCTVSRAAPPARLDCPRQRGTLFRASTSPMPPTFFLSCPVLSLRHRCSCRRIVLAPPN